MIPPKLKRRGDHAGFKKGDLVKLKYDFAWKATKVESFIEHPMIVLEVHGNAIKVLRPDGTIKADLSENYSLLQ